MAENLNFKSKNKIFNLTALSQATAGAKEGGGGGGGSRGVKGADKSAGQRRSRSQRHVWNVFSGMCGFFIFHFFFLAVGAS